MSGINLAPGEGFSPRIVQAIRLIMQGRNNACGSVTLATSTTVTTVEAPNCAETSQVFLQETSAAAAQERAAGGCYVSAKKNGSFIITHANATSTSRSFDWTALG